MTGYMLERLENPLGKGKNPSYQNIFKRLSL